VGRPEVEHDRPSLGDHQVPGLQVAMHDPGRVREVHGPGGLLDPAAGHDQLRLRRRRCFRALQALGQRLARDVAHGDEGQTLVLARLVDRADPRVVEPGRDLRLAPETHALELREPRHPRQDLQRDPAAETPVLGQPDLALGAAAERADQTVGAHPTVRGRHPCVDLVLHGLQRRGTTE
jgi:hypothetical protein